MTCLCTRGGGELGGVAPAHGGAKLRGVLPKCGEEGTEGVDQDQEASPAGATSHAGRRCPPRAPVPASPAGVLLPAPRTGARLPRRVLVRRRPC
jgi:hypothetical protein